MSKQWHGGKGDKPRSVDQKSYADGWDAIFGKKVLQEKHEDKPKKKTLDKKFKINDCLCWDETARDFPPWGNPLPWSGS